MPCKWSSGGIGKELTFLAWVHNCVAYYIDMERIIKILSYSNDEEPNDGGSDGDDSDDDGMMKMITMKISETKNVQTTIYEVLLLKPHRQ